MRIIKNERGSALVLTAGGLAAAGALIAVVLSQGLGNLLDSVTQKNLQGAQERAEKALALGGYFVANNLVLCRENGWRGLTNKCRWAGELFMDPQIPPSKYKLGSVIENESILTYPVDIDPEAASTAPVKLSFDLRNNAKIISFTGQVSSAAQPVDKDQLFVFVAAEADYLDSKGGNKTLKITSVLRRPLGTPSLKLPESPQCAAVCVASNSEGPYGECRGPQAVPALSETSASISVTNFGPGPLYGITYKKVVEYDPDYFPNTASEISSINLMSTDEVLMPGRTISYVDNYPCVQPKSISRTSSSSVGCSRFWRTCGVSGTSTTINVHQEDVARVRYDFDMQNLARNLEPAKLARVVSSVMGEVEQQVTEVTNVTITYIPTH